MSVMRRKESVPSSGHLSGQTFDEVDSQAGTLGRGALMVEMKRAIAREQATRYEEEQRTRDRFSSTLVIAASIIAGIRLARDENISRPSPRLATVIADSIALA